MSCHNANYTNMHGKVNAHLYLPNNYAILDNCRMDCIDWINAQLAKGEVTQESLCDAVQKAGFAKPSQPTISRILTRVTPNPGYKTVNAIIRACGGDPNAWMESPAEGQQRKPLSLDSFSAAELSAELTRRLTEPERRVSNVKK